ncbi:MAG: ABC transporter permease subunit [Actinomycetota bacterium]|nr:ABC transporter permease subunit [Actinomycetota bacterium]
MFLKKEFREILRTWRLWVLPAIMIVVAIISPVFAKITPALLESVAGETPGYVFEVPDPVTVDSYLQFWANAIQMGILGVIIVAAGGIAGERKNGTAILVLTKPVSRGAFVVAKAISNSVLFLAATIIGAAVCVGLTIVMFDSSGIADFAVSTALLYLLGVVFISITLLLGVAIKSQAGAAGASLGAFLAVSLLSIWGPARDYTVAGLMVAGDRILRGDEVALLWPVLTSVVLIVLCVGGAVLLFRRKEL